MRDLIEANHGANVDGIGVDVVVLATGHDDEVGPHALCEKVIARVREGLRVHLPAGVGVGKVVDQHFIGGVLQGGEAREVVELVALVHKARR